jgi:hypothetical protein
MDSAQPTMKAAKTSLLDTIPSTEVEQDLDASAFGVSVEDDIISSSVTRMDVQAEQASELTDIATTSEKAILAENISDNQDVSNILLPLSRESNAEIVNEKDYPSFEVNNPFLNTIEIQDAFIFCPMSEPIVQNETLGQGIFASEREMSDMEEDRRSISNKFITI